MLAAPGQGKDCLFPLSNLTFNSILVEDRIRVTIESLGFDELAFPFVKSFLTSTTGCAFHTYQNSSCNSLVALATTQGKQHAVELSLRFFTGNISIHF